MKRVLKWIWGPALLAAALVCVPSRQAEAQTSFFYGTPRASFGFSTGGYYGAPYPAPYRAYYGPRPYYPRPYGYWGGYRPYPGPRHGHCRW
ncbi:MAG: hypothetical protein JNG90_19035 [Planctomycetaceae bacterium]|nr:hypothetical protein [Planctomycetaceae bacterium]